MNSPAYWKKNRQTTSKYATVAETAGVRLLNKRQSVCWAVDTNQPEDPLVPRQIRLQFAMRLTLCRRW